jgi:hypothetical protein
MWRWRRMEKISQVDRVKHEEVLQRVKEMNFLHTIQGRKEGRKEGRQTGFVTSFIGTSF